MTRTVRLLDGFDSPRDAGRYIDALAEKGVPYEYVDDRTVVVFDDEDEHEKWLELASEPGGFLEKQARRQMLKSAVDSMSDEDVDRLFDELDSEEMA